MRHTRPAAAVTTALTTLVVGGTLLAPSAGAAVPTVDLEPQQLTRGADIAVPHIDEGDFVGGSRRVELPGTVARVIGQVGDGWLVGTSTVDRITYAYSVADEAVVGTMGPRSPVDLLDVAADRVILSGSSLCPGRRRSRSP